MENTPPRFSPPLYRRPQRNNLQQKPSLKPKCGKGDEDLLSCTRRPSPGPISQGTRRTHPPASSGESSNAREGRQAEGQTPLPALPGEAQKGTSRRVRKEERPVTEPSCRPSGRPPLPLSCAAHWWIPAASTASQPPLATRPPGSAARYLLAPSARPARYPCPPPQRLGKRLPKNVGGEGKRRLGEGESEAAKRPLRKWLLGK